jgi:hypothetical protein
MCSILHGVANPPFNGAFLHLAFAAIAGTLRRLQALHLLGALPLPEWGFAVDAPSVIDQSLS